MKTPFLLVPLTMIALLTTAWVQPAQALTPDEAAHLLRRTGFGPRPAELQALLPLSRSAAVDKLLATIRTEPVTPVPDLSVPPMRGMMRPNQRPQVQPRPRPNNPTAPHRQPNPRQQQRMMQRLNRGLNRIEKFNGQQAPPPTRRRVGLAQVAANTAQGAAVNAEQRLQIQRAKWQTLKSWWMQEMLTTPSPLTENMTLFWHNHFTSSLRKVKLPEMMYHQNQLLRQQAVGNFATLLRAIYKDPAMLRYLDGEANLKSQPNENFARELLELFTLGEGYYSEADIKAAARAFTGWGLDINNQTVFHADRHDTGAKTFLGQTGNWQGDDIIRILLAQPRTAEYIVAKLWTQMISPTPDASLVKAWATGFRNGGYALKPLVRTMLGSDAFWSPAARGSLTKSPVDLTVGSFRSLGLYPDPEGLMIICARLDQELFNPPNVKGWPGGTAWIDSRTLMIRQQFLRRLAQMNPTVDPQLAAHLMPLGSAGGNNLLNLLLDERYQLK